MNHVDYRLLAPQFDSWLATRSHIHAKVAKKLARVSVIGFSMVKDIFITKEIIDCCRSLNVAVRHLFASDNQVSLVVDQETMELTLRTLHKHFQLAKKTVPSGMQEVPAA